MITVAVNGFGRIGRNFVRTVLLDPQAKKAITIKAINIGPAKKDFVAHMFKYDTLMGTYPGDVAYENDCLVVDGQRITILAESSVEKVSWRQMDVAWVVDCSGRFTHRADAQKHLDAGAQGVLISAPAHDEDASIILGVNQHDFNKNKHKVVSMGSCTTNAFIPLLKVIHDACTIQNGFMKTVHAYTNSQVLLDVEAKDLRESRAAALNIIPTTTGASRMLSAVMPELEKKIECISLRVPIGKVSLVDVALVCDKTVSVDDLHAAFNHAAKTSMKGILALTHEPLVSSDFNGNSYSVTVDGLLTRVIDNTVNVFGWYDNEWGYSVRLKDFLMML